MQLWLWHPLCAAALTTRTDGPRMGAVGMKTAASFELALTPFEVPAFASRREVPLQA